MKNLLDFDLIIWDLDGTLYYQKEFRKKMAAIIIRELLFTPKRWKELFLILHYRRLREKWDPLDEEKDLEKRQYKEAGLKFGLSSEEVKKVIENWMQEKHFTKSEIFTEQKWCSWRCLENIPEKLKSMKVWSVQLPGIIRCLYQRMSSV